MTKEEKQLLLKDLCARFPYGVKVQAYYEDVTGSGYFDETVWLIDDDDEHIHVNDMWVENIKPYLRPMSSMTKEEKKEFSVFIGKTETYVQQVCLDADSMINPVIGGYKCVYWGLFDKCIDWLLEHHFDYRGLIEKGLALEAPEGMYKAK